MSDNQRNTPESKEQLLIAVQAELQGLQRALDDLNQAFQTQQAQSPELLEVVLILGAACGSLVGDQIVTRDDRHIDVVDGCVDPSSVTRVELDATDSAHQLDPHGRKPHPQDLAVGGRLDIRRLSGCKAETPGHGDQTSRV